MKTALKAAEFWVGGGGGLSGSRQNQFQLESLKSKEAVSYLQNYVTASLQGLAPGHGLMTIVVL